MLGKKTRSVVGLDIEPGFMAAAEFSNGGTPTLQRAATSALAPGLFHEGEVANVDGLADQLRSFFRENNLPKVVRLGVASLKVVVRVIELPDIEGAEELDAAVRFQAQEELPMPLEQAVLDHRVLEKFQDGDTVRMRVLMVAVRRETVDHLIAAARKAGLDPQLIDLSAFAIVRALYVPTNGAAPVNGNANGNGASAVTNEVVPQEPDPAEMPHPVAIDPVADLPAEIPSVDPPVDVSEASTDMPVDVPPPPADAPVDASIDIPAASTDNPADVPAAPIDAITGPVDGGLQPVEPAPAPEADPLAHFQVDSPGGDSSDDSLRDPDPTEIAPVEEPAVDLPMPDADAPVEMPAPEDQPMEIAAAPAEPMPQAVEEAQVMPVQADDSATLYCHVGGLTNLAIANGTECVFNRVLQNGVESMAVALAERKALTLEHARQWINHVALEKDVDGIEGEREIVTTAREVLERGVRKIADEVRLSLEYYQSSVPNARQVDRVVLAGQAIALAGFPAALQQEVGMIVEPRSLGALQVKPGALDGVDGAQLTVAAGLAIEEVKQ